MPTLPPYSTFRTDAKQMMYPQAISHGNVLRFTPPGFKHELNVKFPDSRLAVCEKCKKNFKTRDLCRVRNCHSGAPWTTAYICITIDDSCLDEYGKYVDKALTVRMVNWRPFVTKKPFDVKAPVCAACKRTNRTRTFCRDKNHHRHLPWCTVYVLLTALDQTDSYTLVAAPSQKVDSDGDGDSYAEDSKTNSRDEGSVAGSVTIGSDADIDSDDINDIAESKTFLVKVSTQGSSLHWLDLADYDPSSGTESVHGHGQPLIELPVPPHMYQHMPIDAQTPYYTHGMDYAAMQHQNALKTQQQQLFYQHLQQQQHHQFQPPAPWMYPMYADPVQATEAVGENDKTPEGERDATHDEAYQTLQYHQQHHWAQMHQYRHYPAAGGGYNQGNGCADGHRDDAVENGEDDDDDEEEEEEEDGEVEHKRQRLS
ncbi:hypothetical protein MPSEU_000168500 [Mayamaea pseudoterrestris]|nr:hypothetical protein MPSEU_000168500 [Mayamaea pseudoterrestris]